jgi:endoglucanase
MKIIEERGENMSGNPNETILVNQVGYSTNARKLAMFRGEGGDFQLVNENGQLVYEGKTSEAQFDEASGQKVAIGDFSPVTELGNYQIIPDYTVLKRK